MAAFASNIVTSWTGWLLWFGVFWLMAMMAYRILMTWVYTHTHSVLVAQLMHAGYTGSLIVLSPQTSFEQGLMWQALFAVGRWVMVAVVAFASRPRQAQDATT